MLLVIMFMDVRPFNVMFCSPDFACHARRIAGHRRSKTVAQFNPSELRSPEPLLFKAITHISNHLALEDPRPFGALLFGCESYLRILFPRVPLLFANAFPQAFPCSFNTHKSLGIDGRRRSPSSCVAPFCNTITTPRDCSCPRPCR